MRTDQPSRTTQLRIYWPTRTWKRVTRPQTHPQVALLEINGRPCRLTHWTPREWNRIPLRQRPWNAFAGDRGDYYVLDEETPKI